MKHTYKIVIPVLFLIIMTFACACQPTPERAAVVYGGGLEEEIKGSPAPLGAYDAPASWQETLDIKGSDTKVEINAQINMPNVTAFPVYKVKKAPFDITRIESLVSYFTKGKDVIKDKELTKAELEEQLLLAKRDNDEEYITDLEKRIAAAPEAVQDEVITDWSPDKSPSGSFLAEDGKYAAIRVDPDRFGYMKKGFIYPESWQPLSRKDSIGEITISEEDAVTAAEGMLNELGIDYMAVGSLEKAQRYQSLEDVFTEPAKEPLSKGYLVKFARNIDGITGIMNDHAVAFGIMDDFAYRAPLYPEEIRVYVDETGKAQSFSWSYPVEVEEKLTENTALLPFEDVKQRIRDLLTFINFDDEIPVQVTNIDMNMAIVGVKDHPEEAMYVPAWFVYYTQTFYDREVGGKEQQNLRLALNAIDGGRVLEMPVDNDPEMQQEIDEHMKSN